MDYICDILSSATNTANHRRAKQEVSPTKKLISLLLCALLVLSLCACNVTPEPTEPPTEEPTSAPTEPTTLPTEPPTEEPTEDPVEEPDGRFYLKDLPRMFPEYTDTVPAGQDYGTLVPYRGAEGLYGLCTTEGVVVTDLAFDRITLYGDTYELHHPTKGSYFCASDGSLSRALDSRQHVCPRGNMLVVTTDAGDQYLADLSGNALTEEYQWIDTDTGGPDLIAAWGDDGLRLLDLTGKPAYDEPLSFFASNEYYYVLKSGEEVTVTDHDFKKVSSFKAGENQNYTPLGDRYLDSSQGWGGPEDLRDLKGRTVKQSFPNTLQICISGKYYFCYDDDDTVLYSWDLNSKTRLTDVSPLHAYGDRYLALVSVDGDYSIYDTKTGKTLPWTEPVQEYDIFRGEPCLFSTVDSEIFNALTGEKVFDGELLEVLDTANGHCLVVQQSRHILTVDPDGNVLVDCLL